MTNNTPQARICAIIPTYNNAATILQVVEHVRAYCPDIIVDNDGSTDNTQQLLEELSRDVTVVTFAKNRGKGSALVAGFRKAKELAFTHAITIDADGQHFADDIPAFVKALEEQQRGIVVGARTLTETNMPRETTFANRFTQSGFRLYTLEDLCGLSLITSRYEAELELLVYAAWAGKRIVSIPVKVYYPPEEERVSHFRPVYDFTRISILNTFLCLAAIVYGYPRMMFRKLLK